MKVQLRSVIVAAGLLLACGGKYVPGESDGDAGAAASGSGGSAAGRAGGSPAAGGSAGDQQPWTNGIPPLHTEGRFFKDPAGNVVVLRGVALADTQDVNMRDSALDVPGLITLLSDEAIGFYARVVRLTVYPEIWLPDPQRYFDEHLHPAVEHATARGLYVIIDWHEISDVELVAARTAAFWQFMAPKYASYTNVLYELFNEPMDIADASWTHWKQFAQPWVDQIRRDAPNNVILIGGPYWSQQIGGAASDPFLGENLAYVGHVYPISAPGLLTDSSPIAEAAAARPVIITEWGYRDAGNAVWGGNRASFGEPLEAFVEARGLSWTAWCADTIWEPVMFDAQWTLLTGDANMGGFVKDWLAERRHQDQPARR